MKTYVVGSHCARANWRTILDEVDAGDTSIVIERYGKPLAVLISHEDYQAVEEEIDDLRAGRRAAAVYEEWQRDPSTAVPWDRVRADLTMEEDYL